VFSIALYLLRGQHLSCEITSFNILTISLEINVVVFRSMPRWHGSFSQIKLFLAVLKNAGAFWSAKVPKALCQSSNGPFTQPYAHQKNSGTLFNQLLSVFSLV